MEHQRLLQNLSHGAYLTPGVPLANFFFLSPLSLVFRGFNNPSNSTLATISPVLPTVLRRAGDDGRTRSSPQDKNQTNHTEMVSSSHWSLELQQGWLGVPLSRNSLREHEGTDYTPAS